MLLQIYKITVAPVNAAYYSFSIRIIYNISKENYLGNKTTWVCGYKKNNTIAGYPHVNFLGNIEFFKEIVGYKSY